MTAFEYGGRMILIDAGLSFPRSELLGIDLVLPDFSYVAEHADVLDAVILTHGHEDHIGALPYLFREIGTQAEVWGTRLTLGLVKSKLDEHGLLVHTELVEIEPEAGRTRVGPFDAEFVRVTHSVPDAVAVVLHTEHGAIVHTGDFKLDDTPIDGRTTDLDRLRELGDAGVALLLADSTNAERPGRTPSERTVGAALRDIVRQAQGRVIVTSFASHIHRIQQVIDAAAACGRIVSVVGRSMNRNLNIAREPRLCDRAGRPAREAAPPRRVHAARDADPLHRQPGRAAFRADPDRVRRPSGHPDLDQRHGRRLGAGDPGQRGEGPRDREPAVPARRDGPDRGHDLRERLRARGRRRPLDDARDRPAPGLHARSTASTGCSRPTPALAEAAGVPAHAIADRRERDGARARRRRPLGRRPGRGRHDPRRRHERRLGARGRPARPPPPGVRRRPDRRRDDRRRYGRADRRARDHRPRVHRAVRRRQHAARSGPRHGRARARRVPGPPHDARSTWCSRSSTTPSPSSSRNDDRQAAAWCCRGGGEARRRVSLHEPASPRRRAPPRPCRGTDRRPRACPGWPSR